MADASWIRKAIAGSKIQQEALCPKLAQEIDAALGDPSIVAHLAGLGAEPFPISTAAFDKFIVEQTEKWGRVIRAGNIKLE